MVAEEKEEEKLRFDCDFHLWRGFKKMSDGALLYCKNFSSVQKHLGNRLHT
jgi:hypothetical protein